MWRKYLAEISSLEKRGDISSDDYYLLKASPQARAELVDVTMGDEDAFVEGTPQEILERVVQTITAEESAKFEALLEEERRRRKEAERELQSERVRSRKKERF